MAPGRVNIIGDHTDYNDGFVLPMALPFQTVVAARARSGPKVLVASEGYGEASFSLDSPTTAPARWARYIHGVGAMMRDEGLAAGTWEGCIATDIPGGASLSSSAALEVAAAYTFAAAAGSEISANQAARLGQRVENEVFGLPSGIMDQLASAASSAGHASLIDCRSLDVSAVQIPQDAVVVVMDTGTRRELVDSAYADRQTTCIRVAQALGVPALRDATVADLRRLDAEDDVGRRRATHVITENHRVLQAVAAFAASDLTEAGRLMNQSHTSLSGDYQVSGPAVDVIVDIAQNAPGCFGARMTGGGFAGGAVALVATSDVEAFCSHVSGRFSAPASQPATAPTALYPVTPSPGASVHYL